MSMNEYRGSLVQFPTSKQSMSWRQEDITIPANSMQTITFLDTKPNMFFVQNPSDAIIHVGISNLPTEKNYEFKINNNSTKTFGRPTGTARLYLYNISGSAVTVSLFSV